MRELINVNLERVDGEDGMGSWGGGGKSDKESIDWQDL